MLKAMIRIPTKTIAHRAFILLQRKAARGAAIIPPKMRPTMICQWLNPITMVNTQVEAKVTKNSAVFTVPMVTRGVSPVPTNVVVTTGPQPPPPEASTKPPNKPKTVYC